MTDDEREPMMRETEDRRLRLSREVRIGELVATLIALSGVAGWYIDTRLEPVRLEIRQLQARNLEQDAQQLELKREIRDDLKVMRERLERLVESMPVQRGAR